MANDGNNRSKGTCCAGDLCHYLTHELCNRHKCYECKKIVHVMCGVYPSGSDNIFCKKCIVAPPPPSTKKRRRSPRVQMVETTTTPSQFPTITSPHSPEEEDTAYMLASLSSSISSKNLGVQEVESSDKIWKFMRKRRIVWPSLAWDMLLYQK